jgi:hypothetical protein
VDASNVRPFSFGLAVATRLQGQLRYLRKSGRDQELGVYTVADPTSLATLLDAQAAEAATEANAVTHDLARAVTSA